MPDELTLAALQQQFSTLWIQLLGLKFQLQERLTPVIEPLRPVWNDPLWQFIALLVGVVLIILIVVWLLRAGGSVLSALLIIILDLILRPLSWMKKFLSEDLRAYIEHKRKAREDLKDSALGLNFIAVRRGMDAVRYLTTRRDWRYQTPWYLLIGASDSGKKTWVKSIHHGVRNKLLVREKQLLANGSGWHFFDQGLIIHVEGSENFNQTVSLLNSYRPERPVDGIIVIINAATLLEPGHSEQRRQLGESIYLQLADLQKQTGFVVPVYLNVTQSDVVPGFDSFWSARPESSSDEMFGWANPTRLDTAYSPLWISEAFTSIITGIRAGQLQAAAAGQDIADLDSFILFDKEFQALHDPLKEVMELAFARNSFQEALPLRGIWFSGKVNGKVALTEDFLGKKLWPETHLAHPVEQRRFSANRTLRRFQIATLVLAVFLGLGLIIDTTRLYQYSAASEISWDNLMEIEPDCSDSGSKIWRLLSGLSILAEQPSTFTLPASWGGGQLPAMTEAAAIHVYPGSVFTDMECRLKLRAKDIRNKSQLRIPATIILEELDDLSHNFIADLRQYQSAQKLFVHLAGPLANGDDVGEDFRNLADYLYDGTIPATVLFDAPLLADAIVVSAYDIEWGDTELVDPDRQLEKLTDLIQKYRQEIEEEVLRPPVANILRAFYTSPAGATDNSDLAILRSPRQMIEAIDEFQIWLNDIHQHWLSTRPESSPCGRMHQDLLDLQTQLLGAGYPAAPLRNAVALFSRERCDTPIRQSMATLNVSPFGQLFEIGTSDKLDYSSQMLRWEDEFSAMESLQLLALDSSENGPTILGSSSEGSPLVGEVVAWQSGPLDQALELLIELQTFRQRWWQPVGNRQGEPFYAPVLLLHQQQRIGQLIEQAQVREFTQIPQALSVAADPEATVATRVSSFTRAEAQVRQLALLLRQNGDTANGALLRQGSRDFVTAQLLALTELSQQNRLYKPLDSPLWNKDNFASALFNYGDPAALDGYLQNQRQRIGFMAVNYAQPLVAFLVDTGGIEVAPANAELWLETLIDLRQYARKQPGNNIDLLENFVSGDLSQLSPARCNEVMDATAFSSSSQGLFAASQYFIDQLVRGYCQNYGKTTVVQRYSALVERFNLELAGRYPFASLDDAGATDVDPVVVHGFFMDYLSAYAQSDNTQTGLLQGLKTLQADQPTLDLTHLLEFVSALDQLAQLWRSEEGKDPAFAVALALQFAALPEQSLGMRQIIEWRFSSGNETLIYPNGGERVLWRPGDPLKLSLRWATGSDYRPVSNLTTPVQIDGLNNRALFSSRGQWALFEWLQRFGNINSSATSSSEILSFLVPVALKEVLSQNVADDETTPATSPAAVYVSKVNLRLRSVLSQPGEPEQLRAIPAKIPDYAPGFPADTLHTGINTDWNVKGGDLAFTSN